MGNALKIKDKEGNIWESSYNLTGWLLTETDPKVNVTEYKYDKTGNRIETIYKDKTSTHYQFDTDNRLRTVKDHLGNIDSYDYYPSGELRTKTDASGRKTHLEYDRRGRIYKNIDGNGNVIEYEYADEGASGSGGLQQPSRIIYPTYSVELRYDRRNRMVEKTALADGASFITKTRYDAVGNRISQIDAKDRITEYEYDALGRNVLTIDANQKITSYAYDNRDNLIALTDANQHTHSFVYDLNNQLLQEVLPRGEVTAYQYNKIGDVIEKIDANEQKTIYGYNSISQLTDIDYYNQKDSQTSIKHVDLTYNLAGSLTGYDDGQTTGIYSFDEIQQKTGVVINYGTFALNYGYTYYPNGLKKSFTDALGNTYHYQYDANNMLQSVTLPDKSLITVGDVKWTKAAKYLYPGGGTRELNYNDRMQLEGITVKSVAGANLLNYAYGFDEVGNIKSKKTDHGDYVYQYDQLDRLEKADNPKLADEAYTYDPLGNRKSDNRVAGEWQYNDNNALLEAAGVVYQYDDNGSLIEKNRGSEQTNFRYNLENRLSRVENNNGIVAEYYYDPFGRRLWKEVAGKRTYFLYADEGLVGEYDENGVEVRGYGYQPDSEWTTDPLFLKQRDEFYFYLNDHLGTPQKLVGRNGVVVWAAEFEAFGKANVTVNSIDNPLRFPGQYFDKETQTHYNFHRDYDPALGRYIESDPIGLKGGYNTYAYVKNNPVNYIDYLGLMTCIEICGFQYAGNLSLCSALFAITKNPRWIVKCPAHRAYQKCVTKCFKKGCKPK